MDARPSSIDLSGKEYDALEKRLSQFLGIKVMLVRGWKTPNSYFRAESNYQIDRMSPGNYGIKDAKQAFNDATQLLINSLRANILARDAELGTGISDAELLALQKVRHITLRDGNCAPERAVIIFDPASADDAGNPPWNKSIYWSLFKHSGDQNAWHHPDDSMEEASSIYIRDVVENLDVSPDDLRAYEAMMSIHYALNHQDEFNNLRKMGDVDGRKPQLFRSSLSNISGPGIYRSEHEMPFEEQRQRLKAEEKIRWSSKALGITDKDLFTKIKIGQATCDIRTDLFPAKTFARLMEQDHRFSGLGVNELNAIHLDLQHRLEEAMAKKMTPAAKEIDLEKDYILGTFSDCRILYPLFREVYEQDKSTGPARIYMDTIMAGLQKFFPTITNGPVPELDPKKEPPRTVKGYTKPAAAAKPQTPGPT